MMDESKHGLRDLLIRPIWLFTLSLIVTIILLVALFNDDFSYLIGSLILNLNAKNTAITPTVFGKIVALSFLPLCTVFIAHLGIFAGLLPKGSGILFGFIFALHIIVLIGLTVLFYFVAKPYLSQFVKHTESGDFMNFVSNFKDIYIWYIMPVVYAIVAFAITTISAILSKHVIAKMVLITIGCFGSMIGLPILIGWIGTIIAVIIILAAVGLMVVAFISVNKYAFTDNRKEYVDSEGHKYHSSNGIDFYRDDNGEYFTSSDGGKTIL